MLFPERRDARSPLSRFAAASGRAARSQARAEGVPLLNRTIRWVTAALCLALLLATIGEVWVRVGIDQQVRQVRAQNARLQQDVRTTQLAVADARSAATIEREARSWGYVRPGDHPVLIVANP